MLWRFCEEADGKWVCFHGNENGKEKKVPTTKFVLQWVLCERAVFFFWATRQLWRSAQSSENPTKQSVGQGIGQPLEDRLGHQCRAPHALLVSVRCTEVSWDVHWKPSWSHRCQCFAGASLSPSQSLGLLPFTGVKWGWCAHWGRTLWSLKC